MHYLLYSFKYELFKDEVLSDVSEDVFTLHSIAVISVARLHTHKILFEKMSFFSQKYTAFQNMWMFAMCVFKVNIIVYSAACHICKTVYFLLHSVITSLSQEFWNQTVYCFKINTIDWEQALI